MTAAPATSRPTATPMTTLMNEPAAGWEGDVDLASVIGGIDSHADTIHVAAIDVVGRDLDDAEFPTTPAGYAAALAFLGSFGVIAVIGIEGTSSYGAGIARAARAAGHAVREVTRPDRSERRRVGKSDPIDAYQAARAVLAGRADAAVKDETIEAIRALNNVRSSAVKAATAAMNQIHSLLVTGPVAVREKYRGLKGDKLVGALAGSRPDTAVDSTARAVLTALRMLAKRHQYLTEQANDLADQLRDLVAAVNPTLISARGIGPITAAQLLITAGANPDRLRTEASFAALCGVAPVPASSGKTRRHRLSRGGDRAANCALHTIALNRLQHDPRTRAWADRQRARGKEGLELLRILKRAIAREVRHHLLDPHAVPPATDLRPLREAKKISLRVAVEAVGTTQIHISRIERGNTHDGAFAQRYREWLNNA
jgi:transposase